MADVNVNAYLAEQSGLSEQEVGAIASGVRAARLLAGSKSADELLNTVKEISGWGTKTVCTVGVGAMLSAAGYTISGSTVLGPGGVAIGGIAAAGILLAAGALGTACALGLTSIIEYHVKANFGALARSLVPETVRKYYKALYNVDPSDDLVGLIANATKNLYSLDTILGVVRDDRFNPAIMAAVQKEAEAKRKREAAEAARREKERKAAVEMARKDRMDRLARVYADLPVQKLEPMREFILKGGKYTRDDLTVFDAVVKQRGLTLKGDGNITWPAVTFASLLVGGFIIWRAKGAR